MKARRNPNVVKLLWDVMDVRELVLSIEASGFFSHEPIIVAREDGENVVIEGNRRLAAVKLLLDPELAAALNVNVPVITERAKDALRELPFVGGHPPTCVAVSWFQARKWPRQVE